MKNKGRAAWQNPPIGGAGGAEEQNVSIGISKC